jgi:hypothetical protein
MSASQTHQKHHRQVSRSVKLTAHQVSFDQSYGEVKDLGRYLHSTQHRGENQADGKAGGPYADEYLPQLDGSDSDEDGEPVARHAAGPEPGDGPTRDQRAGGRRRGTQDAADQEDGGEGQVHPFRGEDGGHLAGDGGEGADGERVGGRVPSYLRCVAELGRDGWDGLC